MKIALMVVLRLVLTLIAGIQAGDDRVAREGAMGVVRRKLHKSMYLKG